LVVSNQRHGGLVKLGPTGAPITAADEVERCPKVLVVSPGVKLSGGQASLVAEALVEQSEQPVGRVAIEEFLDLLAEDRCERPGGNREGSTMASRKAGRPAASACSERPN